MILLAISFKCWIWPLLTAIGGFIAGWLLRGSRLRVIQGELDACNKNSLEWKNKYDALAKGSGKGNKWEAKYNTLLGNYNELEGKHNVHLDANNDWKSKYAALQARYEAIDTDYSNFKMNAAAVDTTDHVDSEWKGKYYDLLAKYNVLDTDFKGYKFDNDTNAKPSIASASLGVIAGAAGAKALSDSNEWEGKYNDLSAEFEAYKKDNTSGDELDALKSKYNELDIKYANLESKYAANAKAAEGSDEWEGKYGELSKEFEAYKANYADLESRYNLLSTGAEGMSGAAGVKGSLDLDDWKTKFEDLNTRYAELDTNYNTLLNSSSGFTAFTSKPDKVDDLKKIEGIGPKIEGILNDAGIYLFSQLASANSLYIKKLLTEAGPRYRMHNPGTWPEQAALAADGKWEELKKWQDELDGGKA